MHYTFEQTIPKNIKITASMESFWLFYNFEINSATKIITINDKEGMFAVYISQKSGPPFIPKLNMDPLNTSNFEITDRGGQKIQLNHVRLVESRLVEFSNEVAQLHLFKFSNNAPVEPPKWINTGGWAPQFTNPTHNKGNVPFLKHLFELDGKIQNRYIYWISAQEDGQGTKSFALAMPFLGQSPFQTILSEDGNPLPKIDILMNNHTWSYPPPGNTSLPGAIKGFAMVADGAFKSIALNSAIDEWLDVDTNDTSTVITKLSQVVGDYPTSISRTLNTAHVVNKDSVVQAEPDPAVEILYMGKLNSINPVDPIIKQ